MVMGSNVIQILNIEDKDFQGVIINIFKELKERRCQLRAPMLAFTLSNNNVATIHGQKGHVCALGSR